MKRSGNILKCVKRLRKNKVASTAIEYALIGALIGVAMIGGLNAFGNSTSGAWGGLSTDVENALE